MNERLSFDDEALAGPDLSFLEQISGLPFDGRSGRVTDIDGHVWDLNVADASTDLITWITLAFTSMLSRNERPKSRLRSNAANWYSLRIFMKFAAARKIDFGLGLLVRYKTFLYDNYAASTAYGRFNTVRAACQYLVDKRLCKAFNIPRNESRSKVQAAPKLNSGQTFGTAFIFSATHLELGSQEVNEHLLGLFIDLLWEEIELLELRSDVTEPGPVSEAFMFCAMALMSAACVNPLSIPDLKIGDLRNDDRGPQFRRLHFDKARSGGKVGLPPFPVGGKSARTIPRLWERIKRITVAMRQAAPVELRNTLFLRYDWTGLGPVKVVAFEDGRSNYLNKVLRKVILGKLRSRLGRLRSRWPFVPSATAENRRYAVIRENANVINLSLTRKTAINVANARLGRNLAATQQAVGHVVDSSATNGYLNNREYQQDLDAEIRQAHQFFEDWARRPAMVLPPNATIIATETGADLEIAEKVARDELNLGMGASLVNGHTVVIDTPLNALRMSQWLERLHESQDRMLRENFERWQAVYEPQIALFIQALNDFSYKSREEAQRLGREIVLPFPEVI